MCWLSPGVEVGNPHKGIPDSAFEPIEGDDKKISREFKKKNKLQREGNRTLFDPEGNPWERLGDFATSMMQLEEMGDDTVEEIHRKQEYYNKLVQSNDYLFGRLWADAWCAAFVWKKNNEFAYPITEEVFRNIEKNPYSISTWMRDEIIRLREQCQFFHWHLAFPGVFRVPIKDEMPENEQAGWSGGFDVVLGNPPWERIKLQEQEWFASRRPDIANAANAAQRHRMIAALIYEEPATYAAFLEDQRQAEGEGHFVRVSGRYPLCGRGDVNTYAVFAENMRLLTNPVGRVGCIVPSGIATDDTTKFFFQNLMESQSLVCLYDFENRNAIFPGVHRSYKFCLLTLSGSARTAERGTEFVFFALKVEDLQDDYRRFTLSSDDIEMLNPNTKTCPIFRSRHDAELNKMIYSNVPVLVNERIGSSPWGAYYMRLIDQSDHSQYLRYPWEERGVEWDVPLYEAKLFSAFDHRFSTFAGTNQTSYIAGQPRELSNEEKSDPNVLISPRYFIPYNLAKNLFAKYQDYQHQWLLVWRDVARATDERTCFATAIPKVMASRTCPALGFNSTDTPIVLLTNLNSLTSDYIARQKVGGIHLNFSILKQIPILPPNLYQEFCKWDNSTSLDTWILPRALELTYTAWDLEPFAKDCGYDGPPFRWNDQRRFLLRCELDAAYFHLYGIERDDVDYIMETFPIVKRKDEKLYGEYRTKRVILEMYDEMRRAMEMGEVYRTRLVPGPGDRAVAHHPASSPPSPLRHSMKHLRV